MRNRFLPHARRPGPGARQCGFTMVEWLVTVTVLLIVLAGVVSGVRGLQQRKQMEGAAQTLAADLHLARAQATGSAQAISVTTQSDGRGYALRRCPTAAACDAASPVVKAVTLPSGVSITPGRTFQFQSPKGVLTPTTQSACLTAGPTQVPLKVHIDSSLAVAQTCAVGQASGGLPVCNSAC